MERKIVTYGGYFEAFMETLTDKEQEKIQYGLLLLKTQDRLPKKFVKLIREGIYELRTEFNSNIFRVFSSSTKVGLWFFSTVSKRRLRRHQIQK